MGDLSCWSRDGCSEDGVRPCVSGTDESEFVDCESCGRLKSLLQSRMWYNKFDTIAKGIDKLNDNMSGHTNMYILCDDEWITPIKYEILKMR